VSAYIVLVGWIVTGGCLMAFIAARFGWMDMPASFSWQKGPPDWVWIAIGLGVLFWPVAAAFLIAWLPANWVYKKTKR
jgi:hypothetical protein